MNIRRLSLTVIVGAFLLGGARMAFAAPNATALPSPPGRSCSGEPPPPRPGHRHHVVAGLRVHSAGGRTDLVVDVAGYYAPAIYADVPPAATTAIAETFSSTSMITGYSSALASPDDIIVSVRRNINFRDIQAAAESAGFHASAVQQSSTEFAVRVHDNARNAARAYASVVLNCFSSAGRTVTPRF
jgi:hypothetical protein